MRNQQFFGAGEVFWNRGNSVKRFMCGKQKKGPAEKNCGVFSLRYSQHYIFNNKSTHRYIQTGYFLPKSGHFLAKLGHFSSILKKGEGRPTPPPSRFPLTPLVAHLIKQWSYFQGAPLWGYFCKWISDQKVQRA